MLFTNMWFTSSSCKRSFRLPIPRRSVLLIVKFQTNTVDTVPLVRRRRIALSLEDVSQMASTVRTHNLGPLHAEGAVGMSRHSAREAVEVSGPSAARFKLVICLVEWRIAPSARVNALRGRVFVVFACEGSFGALFTEDAELFFIQNRSPLIVGPAVWV